MANTIVPKQSPTVTAPAAQPAQSPGPAPAQARAAEAPLAPEVRRPQQSPALAAPRTASALQGAATTRVAPDLRAAIPANPKDMDIVCPVLGALVADGRVKMTKDGVMKFDDLRRALQNDLGMTKALADATVSTGAIANKKSQVLGNMVNQEMNVLELRAGMIKHPSDSAILTAGRFDEKKFQTFAAHAENGVMTTESFASAVVAQYKRDDLPGQHTDAFVRGLNFAQVEYTALLAVFGRKDPATGKVGIRVEDLRMLFQDKKIPAHLVERATMPETADIQQDIKLRVDFKLAGSAFRSLATATGLAYAGARLSAGEGERASRGAAEGAGKAAGCPYFAAGGKMPGDQNDVVKAHLPH